MVTLHAYILRELLKAFGLTLFALTALFTMGGGLYNVVHYEGISAGDVLGLLHLLIPMAITLTMPIAAVFAAAIVYGRLAADNELLACRAAGINVHRTFLSAILLSVFVALFTFLFANFVVPILAQRIENFVRSNLRDLVAQQLEGRGFVYQGKPGEDRRTLTAERVQSVSDDALQQKGFEVSRGLHYLLITNPTFTHIDKNGDLVRFAVARFGLIVFDTRITPIRISLLVRDARDFEVSQRRAVSVGEQEISMQLPPLPTTTRLAIADLADLLRWWRSPWTMHDMQLPIQGFLSRVALERFYEYCTQQLAGQRELELGGESEQQHFRITCDSARRSEKGLILTRGRVAVIDGRRPEPIVYTAERVELNAAPLPTGGLVAQIQLIRTPQTPVLEYDPQAYSREPRQKATLSLDGARAPQELLDEVSRIPAAAIVDPNIPLPVPADFNDARIGLQRSAHLWQCKIASAVHSRLGFITSTLVTVLMGAILGVIFRGSQVLAGVGLSLIPFLTVGLLMVLGTNLTKEVSTTQIGPYFTWGGLLVVALADGVALRFGVRR